MKEIIYLDTEIMNSILSQMDEGIINDFTAELQKQKTEVENTHSITKDHTDLKGSLFFGIARFLSSVGVTEEELAGASLSMLEGQKDVLNKAFHDHALNILIQKLEEEKLLKEINTLTDGDIFLGQSEYKLLDFNLLKKTLDANFFETSIMFEFKGSGIEMKEAKKLATKAKPNAEDREKIIIAKKMVQTYENNKPLFNLLEYMSEISGFATDLLGDLAVFKANNEIGLLKKEYLRESMESLSFRPNRYRKVKFLARVVGKKEQVYDGTDNSQFNEENFDFMPNMMLDIVLNAFGIIKENNFIVTPIAIYYE
ncbi:hypothetical protein MKX29_13535 [Cytobacillus sp. FSL R7-0696]|uniref:DUF6414 family protein n=1 Tax=Cytobacillus sp. FSL R7-0696 TaxID=2921691 RepID=UPI0030FAAE92